MLCLPTQGMVARYLRSRTRIDRRLTMVLKRSSLNSRGLQLGAKSNGRGASRDQQQVRSQRERKTSALLKRSSSIEVECLHAPGAGRSKKQRRCSSGDRKDTEPSIAEAVASKSGSATTCASVGSYGTSAASTASTRTHTLPEKASMEVGKGTSRISSLARRERVPPLDAQDLVSRLQKELFKEKS